jgi:hypothetical protein
MARPAGRTVEVSWLWLCRCARTSGSVPYLARQKFVRREKFPLIVELEPLFACNLACLGCGKIQYPAHSPGR